MLQLVTGIEASNIVGVAEAALARARRRPEALDAIVDRCVLILHGCRAESGVPCLSGCCDP